MHFNARIYRTRHGTFAIKDTGDRFETWFEDECLDNYHSWQQALDDLVGGHGTNPSSLPFDTSQCGLSSDMAEWELARMA
jgi:hypothetical protein